MADAKNPEILSVPILVTHLKEIVAQLQLVIEAAEQAGAARGTVSIDRSRWRAGRDPILIGEACFPKPPTRPPGGKPTGA